MGACGDSTGPASDSDGSFSFSYTAGQTSSSFSATGTYPTNATSSHTSTWSTAWTDNTDNSILALSNRATGGGLANSVFLAIDRQSAGTSVIDLDCEPTATTACTVFTFAIGVNEAGTVFSLSCVMSEGSVTISQISSTRVSGTFQGETVCFSNTAIAEGTVTNGTFNLPLMAEEPGGAF